MSFRMRLRICSAKCGRGGAHQLADVLHRHPVLRAQALGLLGFGHGAGVYEPPGRSTGAISSSVSMRACTSTVTADSSPISQPWL